MIYTFVINIIYNMYIRPTTYWSHFASAYERRSLCACVNVRVECPTGMGNGRKTDPMHLCLCVCVCVWVCVGVCVRVYPARPETERPLMKVVCV